MEGISVSGVVTAEFEITFEDGTVENQVLDISARAIRYIDKNYGADADGNRGIEMVFYEDVSFDEETAETEFAEYIRDYEFVASFRIIDIREETFAEN